MSNRALYLCLFFLAQTTPLKSCVQAFSNSRIGPLAPAVPRKLSRGVGRIKEPRFHDNNVVSRSGYVTSLRESSDGEKNSWFFEPPIYDESIPSVSNGNDEQQSGFDFFRTITAVKPASTASEKETTPRKTNKIKKLPVGKKASPLSDLSEIEESTGLIDPSNPRTIFGIAALSGVAAVTAICYSLGLTPSDFLHGGQTLFTDPQAFSQELLDGVKGLGPIGVVYFSLLYMIAEILAVPATPLTLSAGYLFGIQHGIIAVLVGATGAACVGFWISRLFLRDYVESSLLAPSVGENGETSSNTLAKLDKAIGEEGFKLLVLIRLSPIFPFSVTNYLYGASSIEFGPYMLGTLIGFVPTTTAYVYTGMVGQALAGGNGADQPWYVYAGGFAVLAVLVKLVTDVATDIIEAIDEKS